MRRPMEKEREREVGGEGGGMSRRVVKKRKGKGKFSMGSKIDRAS